MSKLRGFQATKAAQQASIELFGQPVEAVLHQLGNHLRAREMYLRMIAIRGVQIRDAQGGANGRRPKAFEPGDS